MSTPLHAPSLHATPLPARATWLRAIGAAGVLWNAFGVFQFATSFSQTAERLMAAGMTAAQAEVYLALPAWITLAFGIGTVGGLLGAVALAARRRIAQPVLAVSLAAYLALFAGDLWHGVFDGMPAQLAIILTVVLIAVLLSLTARAAAARGLLR